MAASGAASCSDLYGKMKWDAKSGRKNAPIPIASRQAAADGRSMGLETSAAVSGWDGCWDVGTGVHPCSGLCPDGWEHVFCIAGTCVCESRDEGYAGNSGSGALGLMSTCCCVPGGAVHVSPSLWAIPAWDEAHKHCPTPVTSFYFIDIKAL